MASSGSAARKPWVRIPAVPQTSWETRQRETVRSCSVNVFQGVNEQMHVRGKLFHFIKSRFLGI